MKDSRPAPHGRLATRPGASWQPPSDLRAAVPPQLVAWGCWYYYPGRAGWGFDPRPFQCTDHRRVADLASRATRTTELWNGPTCSRHSTTSGVLRTLMYWPVAWPLAEAMQSHQPTSGPGAALCPSRFFGSFCDVCKANNEALLRVDTGRNDRARARQRAV